MKFVLSTTVQAHSFDLARELLRRKSLERFFSGYPKDRLAARGIEGPEITSYPTPVLAFMAACRLIKSRAFSLKHEALPKVALDNWVSKRIPPADVFHCTSSVGLESGVAAQRKGALWICDRPCSHIQVQDQLLREEFDRHGKKWPGISQKIIDRELEEYEKADVVLVPSFWAENSFLSKGFDPAKLWRIPLGVSLDVFYKDGEPNEGEFNILYAGRRPLIKGLGYLLEAYAKVEHPRKSLTFVGASDGDTEELIRQAASDPSIRVLSAVPQAKLRSLMSTAHVTVMPSIDDGFGMVIAQAMACGCPVIASEHSGARDIFESGSCGTIVPVRNPDAIAESLQAIANDPDLRESMSTRALDAIRGFSSWSMYVDRLEELVLAKKTDSRARPLA